jgi:hypothetical protein
MPAASSRVEAAELLVGPILAQAAGRYGGSFYYASNNPTAPTEKSACLSGRICDRYALVTIPISLQAETIFPRRRKCLVNISAAIAVDIQSCIDIITLYPFVDPGDTDSVASAKMS